VKYLSLEIKNWGPYRGKHSLDLTTAPGKPVVLIFGENGKGKTSLTDAIRWCLYGSEGSERSGARYANRDELSKGEPFDVEVMLRFSHDIDKPDEDPNNHEVFELRRSFVAKPDERSKKFKVIETDPSASLLIDGKPVDAQVISSWIEALMPREMSRFFIFDGEELIRLKEAIENGVEGVIRESLASVMGVPAIIDLEDSLRKTQKQLDKQLQAATANARLNEELTKLSARLEKKREERDQVVHDLEETRKKINDLREDLLRSKDTQALIEEENRLKSEQKIVETELSIQQDEIRQFLHDNWWLPLSSEIRKTLDREARGRSISKQRQELEWRVKVMKGASSSNVCGTCGQSLPARGDLETRIADLESEIRDLESDEAARLGFSEKFSEPGEKRILLENHLRSSRELLKKKSDIAMALRRVNVRLVGTDKQSMAEVIQRKEREDKREGSLSEIKKKDDDAIDALEVEMSSLRKKLSRDGGIGEGVLMHSKAVNQVLDVMRRVRESLVGKVRNEIETVATENFLQIVHNQASSDQSGRDYTGLIISDDFVIRAMQSRYGEKQNLNYGHSMLVVYAFVAALISVSDAVGAWIIDTPGARLDQGNLESVWRFLAARNDQVIVFPHSNELTLSQAGTWLGNRVSARYELVSVGGRDSDSEIRRVRS
jgi:DNA sulfur modification protein DndD